MRAYALATWLDKSRTRGGYEGGSRWLLAAILGEMELHVKPCGRWGLSPADIEAAPGIAGDRCLYGALRRIAVPPAICSICVAALAPCVIGYAEIGAKLSRRMAPRRLRAIIRIASGSANMPGRAH